MGAFLPSDSYPMVYFSIWEMYGFPYEFPTEWENATKRMIWGNSGKLIIILFSLYGCFFPIRFPSYVYFSIWEMHGFPHKFLTLRENATKPIIWGKSGKFILILFPWYGCFFPIRFPSYGILQHMGNAWVSP